MKVNEGKWTMIVMNPLLGKFSALFMMSSWRIATELRQGSKKEKQSNGSVY